MENKKLIALEEIPVYNIPKGAIVKYIDSLYIYFKHWWIVKYKRTYCAVDPKHFKELAI